MPPYYEDDQGSHTLYHREQSGEIVLNACQKDLWLDMESTFFEEHRAIIERLGVSCGQGEYGVLCRFTRAQARAFMLLHVFMHELGHHYATIHQKHRGTSKGEDYAERFANERFETLYPAYVRVFGDPARANQTSRKPRPRG